MRENRLRLRVHILTSNESDTMKLVKGIYVDRKKKRRRSKKRQNGIIMKSNMRWKSKTELPK